MHGVDGEIAALEEQQAELLRQLKLVQDQISAAKARKVAMHSVVTTATHYQKQIMWQLCTL